MKTLWIILTTILIILTLLGVSYMIPNKTHSLRVRSLSTGEVEQVVTQQPYAVGDTTFKLKVYGVVESID